MSNQFRASGNNRGRSSRFNSNRGNSQSNGSSQAGKSSKKQEMNQKSQLTKLHEEYNPPFKLNHDWQPEEHYKLKLPHPFFPDNLETISFPILSSSTSLSDRALFYQSILDIWEQINFDGANGPNLYYTFSRCLKGAALNDWKDIIINRNGAEERTPENFSDDIDSFIKVNESRDNEDLLQDQLNYMNRIVKPRKTKPTTFKTQLIKLNNHIPFIPGAEDQDKLDESRLKSIFLSAMPPQWRQQFRKVGKKVRDESLEEMAQFFDLFHDEGEPGNKSHGDNNKKHSHSHSKQGNKGKGRPNDNDDCPIHGGGHKWKDCFDNKYSPSYRPPRNGNTGGRGSRNNTGDSHMNSDQGSNDRNTQGASGANDNPQDTNTRSGRSGSDNPYADDFKETTGLNKDEKVPQTVVEARYGSKIVIFGQALLDSGGSRSLIARSRIPKGIIPTPMTSPYAAMSAGGRTEYKEIIKFERVCFSEFDSETWIREVEFTVFEDEGHSAYDLVIGRDLLLPLGFDFSFQNQTVTWSNKVVPFVERNSKPRIPEPTVIESYYNDWKIIGENESYFTESDYDTATTGTAIGKQQEHLTSEQRKLLGSMLDQFNEMFNRVLGVYPHRECVLKLKPNVQPIHTRPFPVPNKMRDMLRLEIKKLVDLKVIEPILNSQWAFPTFLVPKKDNTARFVSDFRLLNKVIEDEQYPLPMIKEVLTRRQGFDWVTAIDLTSQFYHFMLSEASKNLCVITTPFGLYRYNRLPMGVKNSPPFAQAIMESLFRHDFDDVECFIDDIAIFTTGAFEHHVERVRAALQVLVKAGFSIKPKKCFWAVKEVEYLGHIITTDGIKPQPKKINAILRLEAPSTPKQLRSFIGMVNYYRDFIRKRSHMLAPLTAQTKSKKTIKWSDECQQSFEKLKAALAQDALLSFPNPNFPFVIEPDASDYQLGSVVIQNTSKLLSESAIIKLFTSSPSKVPDGFRPLAYFSRKLSSAQMNYTTLEKELLSIVETLLEYRSFLYGRKIFVFTDHRNLTFNNMKSQRALRWRLIAEEFNITLIHRAGESNVAADALSRLPLMDPEDPSSVKQAEERFYDSYLFYPVQNHMDAIYPLDFKSLQEAQQDDQFLIKMIRDKHENYNEMAIGQYTLIHFRTHPQKDWKIVLPLSRLPAVINWFHKTLNHPGTARMYHTITRHFYTPRLKAIIEDFVRTCDICQRIKDPFPKIGQVPEKYGELNPWEEVQVDLIGPWTFKLPPKWEVTINAITAIDPFIGLCEMRRLKNSTCAHTTVKFHNMWLTRYPRALRCIHDNGPEFLGIEFQDQLKYYGIQDVTTTVKNPQANSIIERMHLTVGSIFRSMVTEATLAKRQILPSDLDDFVDTAIASATHAINATVHSVTRESPGAFIYQRDMMLPIQSIANWETIRLKKQEQIHRNFLRENQKRRPFDWQPNMEVLVEEPTRYKLNPRCEGPFTIVKVHTNGTVTLKIKDNVFKRLNIRRIKPYYRRQN